MSDDEIIPKPIAKPTELNKKVKPVVAPKKVAAKATLGKRKEPEPVPEPEPETEEILNEDDKPNENEPTWQCVVCEQDHSKWTATCSHCNVMNPEHDNGASMMKAMAVKLLKKSKVDNEQLHKAEPPKPELPSKTDKDKNEAPVSQGLPVDQVPSASQSKDQVPSQSKDQVPSVPQDPLVSKDQTPLVSNTTETVIDLYDLHTLEACTYKHLIQDRANIRMNLHLPDFGSSKEYKTKFRPCLYSPLLYNKGVQRVDKPTFKFLAPYGSASSNVYLWPYGAYLVPHRDLLECKTPEERESKMRELGKDVFVYGPDAIDNPETGRKAMYAVEVQHAKYRMTLTNHFGATVVDEATKLVLDTAKTKSDFEDFLEVHAEIVDRQLRACAAWSCYWNLFGSALYEEYKKNYSIEQLDARIKKYNTAVLFPQWFYDMFEDVLFHPYKYAKEWVDPNKEEKKDDTKSDAKTSENPFQLKSRFKNTVPFKRTKVSNIKDQFRYRSANNFQRTTIEKSRMMFGEGQFCSTAPFLTKFPKYHELIVPNVPKEKFLPVFKEWVEYAAEQMKTLGIFSAPVWQDEESGMVGINTRAKLVTDEKKISPERRAKPSPIIEAAPRHKKWFAEGYRLNELPLFDTIRRFQSGPNKGKPLLIPWQHRNIEQYDVVAPYLQYSFKCWPDSTGSKFHARTFLEIDIRDGIMKGASAMKRVPKNANEGTSADLDAFQRKYGKKLLEAPKGLVSDNNVDVNRVSLMSNMLGPKHLLLTDGKGPTPRVEQLD